VKNCKENGGFWFLIMLNPHSNNDIFLLGGGFFFFCVACTIVSSKMRSVRDVIHINWIFIILWLSNWKLEVLIILKESRLLISIALNIGIIKLRLRSVSIRRRIRILLCVI